MFEKRYTPFYGPSQLPLRLRVHVEDGWLNGAWSVYNFVDRRLRIINDFSNAWLQWKSNPYWRKPCFWLDLCKTFGRTMKVMHSVWDTSRLFYPNLFVCCSCDLGILLRLLRSTLVWSKTMRQGDLCPWLRSFLFMWSESEGRACPSCLCLLQPEGWLLDWPSDWHTRGACPWFHATMEPSCHYVPSPGSYRSWKFS